MKQIESYSPEIVIEARERLATMRFDGRTTAFSDIPHDEQENLVRIACHAIEKRVAEGSSRQEAKEK